MGMLMPELAKITAARLGINVRTVESHRARIRNKLGMSNAQLFKEFASLDLPTSGPEDRARSAPALLNLLDRADPHARFAIDSAFRFSPMVNPDAVTVMMVLGTDLGSKGYLLLPGWVQHELQMLGYPTATEQMPLAMAMAYGLYIALSTRTELALSGDPGAWDQSWGELEGARRS